MKNREELEQMIKKDAFANAEELAQFSVVEIYARGMRSMLPLIENLQRQNEKLKTACAYYADEKNWYNPNQHTRLPSDPEQRMVIASIDTEGANWLGGRAARQALTQADSIAKELEKK